MTKFKGKYTRLMEQTLYRYQQGGLLRGDYVQLKKDALNNPIVKEMSQQVKDALKHYMDSDTYFRVSYIKSGASEAFSGPVDAANIPAAPLWADVVHEYAPGMWKDPFTLPLEVLKKVEVSPAEGYAQYPDSIKRDNNLSNDEAEEVDQTMGKDENRNLTRKNKTLDTASYNPRRENDMIFESYVKTQKK